MFTPFSHYLGFGSTDQETLRSLRGRYDGLTVPGTIAAYQRQGTGGFVLTLSAASSETPYFIDPRFPLFQNALTSPKASHVALAEACGDTGLVSTAVPSASDFDAERIDRIASSWLNFNRDYQGDTTQRTLDKYARRLGEVVDSTNVQPPQYIVPPYFCVRDTADPLWEVAKRFTEVTRESANDNESVVPVIAVQSVGSLRDALADCGSERALIWISGFDEREADAVALAMYAKAVRDAVLAGQAVAALYGGFYAVLMGCVGLAGASHGIGFGESRVWVELPQSGPPPARYYAPRLHRYIQQDLAQRLFDIDPVLSECLCAECDGRPPILLDYHDLMKHSVAVRAAEIAALAGRTSVDIVGEFDREVADTSARVASAYNMIAPYVGNPDRLISHLPRYRSGIESAST